MIVIAKNQTNTLIKLSDISFNIAPYSSPDLGLHREIVELFNSQSLKTRISKFHIIINDGEKDLSVSEALKYLSRPINNIDTSIGKNSMYDILFEFGSYDRDGYVIDGYVTESIRTFLFRGKDVYSVEPYAFKIVASKIKTTKVNCDVQLYDFTNDTIISVININDSIINIPIVYSQTIDSVPTTESILQIRAYKKSSSTGTTNVTLHSASIIF